MAEQEQQEPLKGEAMADMLAIVAWLVLLSGITGAIIVWTVLGSIEAPSEPGLFVTKIYSPAAIGTGFGLLFGGIIWFVLFKVVVTTFRHVVDIRKMLGDR